MKYKFKVGQKVKRVKDYYHYMACGDIDTIIGFKPDGRHFSLKKYGGSDAGHDMENFELVGISNPNSNIIIKS